MVCLVWTFGQSAFLSKRWYITACCGRYGGGWQAIKALREAADKVKQPEGKKSQPPQSLASATAAPASEASTPEAEASKEDEEQSQVMLALGSLLSSEPAAAVQVTRAGAWRS